MQTKNRNPFSSFKTSLNRVFENRFYRRIFVILLISSLGSSFSAPILSLFSRTVFNASNSQISLYFTLVSGTGAMIVLAVGKLFDNLMLRHYIIVFGFLWLSLGYIFLSFSSRDFIEVLIVGVVFFSLIGIPNAQIFALAKDISSTEENNNINSSVMSTLRVAYSAGWVLGPAVAGFVLTLGNIQIIFRISAAIYFISALISMLYIPRFRPIKIQIDDIKPSNPSLMLIHYKPLIMFGISIFMVLSGDILRVSLLPIYLKENLRAQSAEIGIAFSITPFFEVLFMLLMGTLTDYFREKQIVLAGVMICFVYYLGISFSYEIWHIFVLQILYAFCIASIIGVGIGYAQRLVPEKSGLATSAFFSSQSAAVTGGSLLAGLTSQIFEIRVVFLLSAFLCISSGVIILSIRDVISPKEEVKP